MGGGGGFYANDIEDGLNHDDEETFDAGFSHIEFNDSEDGQMSNTLGLIHPASEGKDTSHRGQPLQEPEYVK